jgi:hypothetical protein
MSFRKAFDFGGSVFVRLGSTSLQAGNPRAKYVQRNGHGRVAESFAVRRHCAQVKTRRGLRGERQAL